MSEKEAERYLKRILKSFTVGSVLHLLAEIYRQSAEEAKQAHEQQIYKQRKLVEHSLVVVGMGVDAACPL